MKKLIFSLSLICAIMQTEAQISTTPIGSTSFVESMMYPDVKVVNLSDGSQRIIPIHAYSETIVIYDISFNIIKTVNFSSLGNYIDLYYQGAGSPIDNFVVSANLFNTDDKLEFLIRVDQNAKIVNEDLQVIFETEGYFLNIIETQNGKLLVVEREEGLDYYALPGYIEPTGIQSARIKQLSSPYPNPAKMYINLTYILPENVSTGIIQVFNLQGQLIKTLPVDNSSEYVRLETSYLSAGSYFYALDINGQKGESKQFIVTK
jgi:hypothetical protein